MKEDPIKKSLNCSNPSTMFTNLFAFVRIYLLPQSLIDENGVPLVTILTLLHQIFNFMSSSTSHLSLFDFWSKIRPHKRPAVISWRCLFGPRIPQGS